MKNKQIWLGLVEIGFAKIDSNVEELFTTKDTALTHQDSVHVYVLHFTNERYVFTSFLARELPSITDTAVKAFDKYNVDHMFSRVNFDFLVINKKKIVMSLERFLIYTSADNKTRQIELPRNNIILKLNQTSDGNIWMLQKNSSSYEFNINKEV